MSTVLTRWPILTLVSIGRWRRYYDGAVQANEFAQIMMLASITKGTLVRLVYLVCLI
jgi:hypothetical protein